MHKVHLDLFYLFVHSYVRFQTQLSRVSHTPIECEPTILNSTATACLFILFFYGLVPVLDPNGLSLGAVL